METWDHVLHESLVLEAALTWGVVSKIWGGGALRVLKDRCSSLLFAVVYSSLHFWLLSQLVGAAVSDIVMSPFAPLVAGGWLGLWLFGVGVGVCAGLSSMIASVLIVKCGFGFHGEVWSQLLPACRDGDSLVVRWE